LFFQVVRIVEHFKPQEVLFENVARIVNSNHGADLELIVDTMSTIGYDSKWTVCSANEVGLPQVRKRWFCLCTRRDAKRQHTVGTLSEPPHVADTPSPPLLCKRNADYVSRYFVLGNTIVPAVVTLAYRRLTCDFVDRTLAKKHTHGFAINGKTKYVQIDAVTAQPYCIVVSPTHYKPVFKPHNLPYRSKPILADLTLRNWPTPRATAPRHSNSLTHRNITDLPTIALFASKVQGKDTPAAIQGMSVNPEFLEWLMGYPVGYTDISR
jgi:hypothetical protein